MKKLQNRISLYFLFFSTLISIIIILLFYFSASSRVMTDIVQRLKDVTTIAARVVNTETHSKLKSPTMQNSYEYEIVKDQLIGIKKASPDIFSVYTVRQNEDGNVIFVADSEYGQEIGVKLGELYPDASELLSKNVGSMKSTLVEEKLYTDEWGTWLSGYSPLLNKDGTLSGILVIDMSAETVRKYMQDLVFMSVFILLLSILPALFIGRMIGRRVASPIIEINEAAEKIGHEQFDYRVEVKGSDEVSHLGNSINIMAEKLKKSRANLQEALEKYKGIFDDAVEGIFQTTVDGVFITANDAMIRMLEYENLDELVNSLKDVQNKLYRNPEDRDEILEMLFLQKKINQFETAFIRKSGAEISVEINAHLIKTKDGDYIIEGIVHDITSKKEQERTEKEKQIALASSRAKSEFLANMSHEIRTPLNAIMGMTDLVLRTELSEKQRGYLNKARISSKTLLAVINDILDFSKIEAGRLELEEINFSLYEVMENITEIFSQKAHEKKIELLISIDKSVPNALIGDPIRLGQVLINLAGNAIKFTTKGEVVISVKKVETQNGDVILEFSVKDTGIGISPERLEKIFDSFTQEDTSTTRKFGGTGLGLSISKKLVTLMNGKIKVESEPGKGSIFSFTSKIKKQPDEKQIKMITPAEMKGIKVLIVDDNATSREILSQIIGSFNMVAYTAEDGEKALELLKSEENQFDLVLMDWKLPGINGIETSKIIKQENPNGKIPIIFMVSAYAREDLLHESEKKVIDAFIHKPVNQSFLFDTIVGLFGKEHTFAVKKEESHSYGRIDKFKNRRILLVEDNPINREIAVEWLESEGMNVETAENGLIAVQMASSNVYELVLMDIQLPEMDGFEATAKIRENPDLKNLPIIAMTAHALKGDREKCIESGMDDYVTKPIDPEKLFSTMAKWISPSEKSITGNVEYFKVDINPDKNDYSEKIEIPGINTETGLFRSNHNLALYKKLLNSFGSSYGNAGNTIKEKLENGSAEDLKEVVRIVHSVKGVSANLGIETLSTKASEYENELGNAGICEDSMVQNGFFEELDYIIREIDEYFQKAGNPTEESSEPYEYIGRSKIADNLNSVLKLLDEDAYEAGEILRKNIEYLKETEKKDKIDELTQSMENYDMDNVKIILENILMEWGKQDER